MTLNKFVSSSKYFSKYIYYIYFHIILAFISCNIKVNFHVKPLKIFTKVRFSQADYQQPINHDSYSGNRKILLQNLYYNLCLFLFRNGEGILLIRV